MRGGRRAERLCRRNRSISLVGKMTECQRGLDSLVTVGCAQTFLGMGGPRAAGHREKFGGKHAATMLAIAALLWQPISQAGMYSVKGGDVTRQSFSEFKVTPTPETTKPAPHPD